MSTIKLDRTSWEYAPYDFCKQAKIAPNRLAYDREGATLIGIVKRSRSGDDYALSKGLLDLLIRLRELGKRKDESPVQSAIVVLMDGDKIVEQCTAQEMQNRLKNISPNEGQFGLYWWIKPTTANIDDEAWG